MPSPITTLELIKSSMRLIGVLESGEDPTPDEANDALRTLQDLLENWSTEKLSVWGAANQTFNLVAGQATYTIGPAGNFNTARPVDLSGGYVVFSSESFNIVPISQDQYDLIALKTLQQPIPEQMLYVNEFPLGQITFWPVPSQALPVTLSIGRILTAPVNLTDALTGPPGFIKAVRFCLAVELAPEFGKEASSTVVQVAMDAKGDYKKTNQVPVVARYDGGLLDSHEDIETNWG